MKQRFLALLLALALAFALLPAGAWAAPAGDSPVLEEEVYSAGYGPLDDGIDRTDLPDNGAPHRGDYGRASLSGPDLKLYDILREKVLQIANGTLTETEFSVDTTGWGLTRPAPSTVAGGDPYAVRTVLRYDLPFEFYWYENMRYTFNYNSQTSEITRLNFKFGVNRDYAPGGITDPLQYRTDPAKVARALAAARNAQAVVNQYREYTDYDKLLAYQEYIREQVEYNYPAADDDNFPYGDPWNAVSVFDGDPTTNVVCDGYTKAFQYLCELSHFSNDIDCSRMVGDNHAWNLVRINGQGYVVDITAADTGLHVYGTPGFVFLAGTPDSDGNGYTLHFPRYDLPDGRYYKPRDHSHTYNDTTKSIFPADVLTLAPTSYGPFSRFSDLSPTGYYRGAVEWAVLSGVTTGATNTTFEPDAQCTHGQILTFLWRAAGSPKSSAEPPIPMTGSEYYYDALKWAKEKNILTGSFNADTPNTPCSRLYAVYYMWLAKGRPEAQYANNFTDVGADWTGAESVAWALNQGITTGATSTTFEPNTICTRGQIVTFLRRCFVFAS